MRLTAGQHLQKQSGPALEAPGAGQTRPGMGF